MHATPSEISITRALSAAVPPERSTTPWSPLPAGYLRDHAGGRPTKMPGCIVRPSRTAGSAPIRPCPAAEDGHALLATAARELAADYRRFVGEAGQMKP